MVRYIEGFEYIEGLNILRGSELIEFCRYSEVPAGYHLLQLNGVSSCGTNALPKYSEL